MLTDKTQKKFDDLQAIVNRIPDMNGYTTDSQANKDLFHRRAKAALKSLAQDMGLEKGSYDVRSNKGGPAVAGEIILHAESFYVEVSGRRMLPSTLHRTCDGLKDYSSGINNFCTLSQTPRAVIGHYA